MCGIVGFFEKNGGGQDDVGQTILNMLRALGCRGPDSAGVALYGATNASQFVVRVKLGDDGDRDAQAHQISARLESFGSVRHFSIIGAYARLVIAADTDLKRLVGFIESIDNRFEVVSVGHALEIVKQTGSPDNLEKTYGVSQIKGTHGLGHTRLSTE